MDIPVRVVPRCRSPFVIHSSRSPVPVGRRTRNFLYPNLFSDDDQETIPLVDTNSTKYFSSGPHTVITWSPSSNLINVISGETSAARALPALSTTAISPVANSWVHNGGNVPADIAPVRVSGTAQAKDLELPPELKESHDLRRNRRRCYIASIAISGVFFLLFLGILSLSPYIQDNTEDMTGDNDPIDYDDGVNGAVWLDVPYQDAYADNTDETFKELAHYISDEITEILEGSAVQDRLMRVEVWAIRNGRHRGYYSDRKRRQIQQGTGGVVVEFMVFTSPPLDDKVKKDILNALGPSLASGSLGVLPVLADEHEVLLHLGEFQYTLTDAMVQFLVEAMPGRRTVPVGAGVLFTCAYRHPESPGRLQDLTWYLPNGQPVPEWPARLSSYQDEEKNVLELRIIPTDMSDQGLYRCGHSDTLVSETVQLNVMGEPAAGCADVDATMTLWNQLCPMDVMVWYNPLLSPEERCELLYGSVACLYEQRLDCSQEQLVSLAYASELGFYDGGLPNYSPHYCGVSFVSMVLQFVPSTPPPITSTTTDMFGDHDVIVHPERLSVGSGTGISFWCYINHRMHSIRDATWHRPAGEPLQEWPSRISVVAHEDQNALELRMLYVEAEDKGEYICSLGVGSRSARVTLDVTASPASFCDNALAMSYSWVVTCDHTATLQVQFTTGQQLCSAVGDLVSCFFEEVDNNCGEASLLRLSYLVTYWSYDLYTKHVPENCGQSLFDMLMQFAGPEPTTVSSTTTPAPPMFLAVVEPSSRISGTGAVVSFFCYLATRSQVSVEDLTWSRPEGRAIPTWPARVSTLVNEYRNALELRFVPSEAEDSGHYICSLGSDSTDAVSLEITGRPSAGCDNVQNLYNQWISRCGTLLSAGMSCQRLGAFLDCFFHHVNPGCDGRALTNLAYMLTVTGQVSDPWLIRNCGVDIVQMLTSWSPSPLTTVLPPALVVSPLSLNVGAGTGVSFICSFSSSHEPYTAHNLTWSRHGMSWIQEIPHWPQRVGVLENQEHDALELRFLVTEPSDTDTYSCELRGTQRPVFGDLQVSGRAAEGCDNVLDLSAQWVITCREPQVEDLERLQPNAMCRLIEEYVSCFHEHVNAGCDEEDLRRLSYFVCPSLYSIYEDFMPTHCRATLLELLLSWASPTTTMSQTTTMSKTTVVITTTAMSATTALPDDTTTEDVLTTLALVDDTTPKTSDPPGCSDVEVTMETWYSACPQIAQLDSGDLTQMVMCKLIQSAIGCFYTSGIAEDCTPIDLVALAYRTERWLLTEASGYEPFYCGESIQDMFFNWAGDDPTTTASSITTEDTGLTTAAFTYNDIFVMDPQSLYLNSGSAASFFCTTENGTDYGPLGWIDPYGKHVSGWPQRVSTLWDPATNTSEIRFVFVLTMDQGAYHCIPAGSSRLKQQAQNRARLQVSGVVANNCDNMIQLYGRWMETCPDIHTLSLSTTQNLCRELEAGIDCLYLVMRPGCDDRQLRGLALYLIWQLHEMKVDYDLLELDCDVEDLLLNWQPPKETTLPTETTTSYIQSTESDIETTEYHIETTESDIETTERDIETTESEIETTESFIETTERYIQTTERYIQTTVVIPDISLHVEPKLLMLDLHGFGTISCGFEENSTLSVNELRWVMSDGQPVDSLDDWVFTRINEENDTLDLVFLVAESQHDGSYACVLLDALSKTDATLVVSKAYAEGCNNLLLLKTEWDKTCGPVSANDSLVAVDYDTICSTYVAMIDCFFTHVDQGCGPETLSYLADTVNLELLRADVNHTDVCNITGLFLSWRPVSTTSPHDHPTTRDMTTLSMFTTEEDIMTTTDTLTTVEDLITTTDTLTTVEDLMTTTDTLTTVEDLASTAMDPTTLQYFTTQPELTTEADFTTRVVYTTAVTTIPDISTEMDLTTLESIVTTTENVPICLATWDQIDALISENQPCGLQYLMLIISYTNPNDCGRYSDLMVCLVPALESAYGVTCTAAGVTDVIEANSGYFLPYGALLDCGVLYQGANDVDTRHRASHRVLPPMPCQPSLGQLQNLLGEEQPCGSTYLALLLRSADPDVCVQYEALLACLVSHLRSPSVGMNCFRTPVHTMLLFCGDQWDAFDIPAHQCTSVLGL